MVYLFWTTFSLSPSKIKFLWSFPPHQLYGLVTLYLQKTGYLVYIWWPWVGFTGQCSNFQSLSVCVCVWWGGGLIWVGPTHLVGAIGTTPFQQDLVKLHAQCRKKNRISHIAFLHPKHHRIQFCLWLVDEMTSHQAPPSPFPPLSLYPPPPSLNIIL